MHEATVDGFVHGSNMRASADSGREVLRVLQKSDLGQGLGILWLCLGGSSGRDIFLQEQFSKGPSGGLAGQTEHLCSIRAIFI